MTKEPQPTTHNAEPGARSTCRERSETGWLAKHFEDMEKRGRRFGETYSVKYVGDLEKCGRRSSEIRWRFGEMWSAIWRNTLEIWRNVAEQLWRSCIGVR